MTKDPSGHAHVASASSSPPIGGLRKRSFDIVVALCGLVLLSPLLAAVACLLRIVQGAPVLTREPTIGAGGQVFNRLAFRVRREPLRAAGAQAAPVPASLGQVLARAGLVAMPQLINVLRGEMSVVGPKPRALAEAETCAETALAPEDGAGAEAAQGSGPAARPGLIVEEVDRPFMAREAAGRGWSFSDDLRAVWKAMSQRRHSLFY